MAWSILSLLTRSLHPSTRGSLFKLEKVPVVSERDKNIFSNRAINIWNSLYIFVIELDATIFVASSSIKIFK